MVEMLQWLAYTLLMSGIGCACLWWFWTQASAGVGERVRTLTPPDGVVLEPASRHAIFEELYRRQQAGFRPAIVVYVLMIIAVHPMYVSDRLSDGAQPMTWGVALFLGFTIGETYAATRAARAPLPGPRVATLAPRDAATYLSPLERVAQLALVGVLVAAGVSLTVDVATTDAPAWITYAMYVCWAWLAITLTTLLAQRWVLAQAPPLADRRELIVREFVTASAMQQLHKAIWLSGGLAYITAIGFALGPAPTSSELVAGYGPVALVFAAVLSYRRWRRLPDPVWHFARTTGSPV